MYVQSYFFLYSAIDCACRSNLVVIYPATQPTKEVISFVGMHMDCVSANDDQWSRDPFTVISDIHTGMRSRKKEKHLSESHNHVRLL